jgi:4'-phosphopantetheinyl transferase
MVENSDHCGAAMLTLRTTTFSDAASTHPPPLGYDEAHVWIVSLDVLDASRTDTLSPAECARASRFTSELARVRFIQRRSALRAILSGYTSLAPASLTFAENAYGKPILDPDVELSFSTSHSDSMALIAIARRALIGIDIEKLRPEAADFGVAARFFTPNEAAALARLDAPDCVSGFFNAWTRKEAVLKALGRGLSIPLDAFEVALQPEDAPAVLDWNVPDVECRTWELCHLEPQPGFVGALAFSRA